MLLFNKEINVVKFRESEFKNISCYYLTEKSSDQERD